MKRFVSLLVAFVFVCSVAGCDSKAPSESVETTSATTIVTEATTTEEPQASEITNPNVLPVYIPVEVKEYESVLKDIELDDEAMSKLLGSEDYPFRTSFGMGFDSKFTTDYLTTYINDTYGTDFDQITIDDVNFYNTNHYYIPAEKFDGDVVNRHIWFSFLSEQFDLDFDYFMVNRAILLSLDLVPMIDEIPASYIEEYCPIASEIDAQYLDEIMNAWLWESDRKLTTEEEQFVNIIKYNIWYHDLYNWTYNIPVYRRTTGEISVCLTPNTSRYQGIIDGCSSLGVTLNTQMQYYEDTNQDVRVIIADTPEFFEETYGRTYVSVLEEYGLPVNPK